MFDISFASLISGGYGDVFIIASNIMHFLSPLREKYAYLRIKIKWLPLRGSLASRLPGSSVVLAFE
jgi:hypothetical protein